MSDILIMVLSICFYILVIRFRKIEKILLDNTPDEEKIKKLEKIFFKEVEE